MLSNALVKLAGLAILVTVTGTNSTQAIAESFKCLYISSYHKGYAWSDGVERGLKSALGNKCDFRQFNMDTKRKKSATDISNSTEKALDIIDTWQPDIIITSDDNAAKYIIAPHFKNSDIPIVFSGVNWTVEEYGFPLANVTGIVEVAPIAPMLKEASRQSAGNHGFYLAADTLTEEKNYQRNKIEAEKLGIQLDKSLVSTFEDWKKQYKGAQLTHDFLVIGSNSGISSWNDQGASKFALDNAQRFSVTNMQWMMPVSTLGYTKIPSEHGEWAGQAAVAILEGMNAKEIPIATNRKWELWINENLESASSKKLSNRLKKKAKKLASAE